MEEWDYEKKTMKSVGKNKERYTTIFLDSVEGPASGKLDYKYM